MPQTGSIAQYTLVSCPIRISYAHHTLVHSRGAGTINHPWSLNPPGVLGGV